MVELFVPNADADARAVSSCAVISVLACAFLLVRLATCRPLPSRPLRNRSALTTLGLVRHPVGLAKPDHAAARGQPSTQPPVDAAQLCPRAAVW